MYNKKIVLEDMIKFTGPVITIINLITKSNFKRSEVTKIKVKSIFNYLEEDLKKSEINKKCIKDAIHFNLDNSLFIDEQDSKFTFREKSNYIFDILDMKSSEIYNIIIDCIDSIEEDISVRGKQ